MAAASRFCSELRSLWAADSSALRVLPLACNAVTGIRHLVPDPLTIFSGLGRKLPPAHLPNVECGDRDHRQTVSGMLHTVENRGERGGLDSGDSIQAG